MQTTHQLEVWGDFACFTRPETKIERFSYPVMTPSAARGILDAIYAKPAEFRWAVRTIEVLSPISYINLMRNEVKEKASVRAIQTAMNGASDVLNPILADVTDPKNDRVGRTQRQTIALRDVRYRIHAEIRRWPGCKVSQQALDEQFLRRAMTGKCFAQPFLGCREFPAYFALPSPERSLPPISVDMDLGWMLYDVYDLSRPAPVDARPRISLFRASLRNGVMQIPDYDDPSVRKVDHEC
ncbi:MAG: type I-C CRISPR-associated protein Cas5c [Halothiobacillaceae bacterium]